MPGVVALPIAVLMVGSPQQSTKIGKNGERHPRAQDLSGWCASSGVGACGASRPSICRPACRARVAPAHGACSSPRSSGNRQIRLGRQKRRKTTVTTSEKIPAAISTRLLSTWLDQKYCIPANDNPDHQNRRKHFERFFPADHGSNQPEGNDHRRERQDSANHLAQIAVRKRRRPRPACVPGCQSRPTRPARCWRSRFKTAA